MMAAATPFGQKQYDLQYNQSPPHCLIVPFPTLSHINPMLQFAKRLYQLHHVRITLIVSNYLAKTAHFPSRPDFPFATETFSDGHDDGVPPGTSHEVIAARFHQVGPPTLKDAIRRLHAADPARPVGCLVYDSFLTWAIDAAEEFGIKAAVFFTQSCCVNRIYHHICNTGRDVMPPVPCGEEKIVIPGLPVLETRDMPSFISEYGSYPTILKSAIEQFRGLEKADWIFFNTFYELEEEVIDYMSKSIRVTTIGPTIPSIYLDERLPNDRKYEVEVYSSSAAAACLEWLDQRLPGSVAYVSFGSLARLDEVQMEELGQGLKLTNKHFLWVVRLSEQWKLPEELTKEIVGSGKALIVPWCHQVEVLAHDAIGCFVTHCGWNSTLEAVSLGVPMVAVPQWSDQPTTAKLVEDVWKVGIRAAAGEDGVVRREAIEKCVNEVMEGGMRRNASKWKELARAAMNEGGSSHKN